MQIITGDIWNLRNSHWIGITTNGAINTHGGLVMGRGVALQAKEKFPGLDCVLAERVKAQGNRVYLLPQLRLFSFPVKHLWNQQADLDLIQQSAEQLRDILIALGPGYQFALPRPGCGNGQRNWGEVKPRLKPLWDIDNISIIDLER